MNTKITYTRLGGQDATTARRPVSGHTRLVSIFLRSQKLLSANCECHSLHCVRSGRVYLGTGNTIAPNRILNFLFCVYIVWPYSTRLKRVNHLIISNHHTTFIYMTKFYSGLNIFIQKIKYISRCIELSDWFLVSNMTPHPHPCVVQIHGIQM